MSQDARPAADRRGTTAADMSRGRAVGPDYSGPGVEAELDGTGQPDGQGHSGGDGQPSGQGHSGGDDYDTMYTARASSRRDGGGRVITEDGLLDLKVRAPRQLGGTGEGTNPEQLLAAAYATCFHNSLELVAERGGVSTADARVDAAVRLRKRGKSDDYTIGVELVVHLPGADPETAGRLAEQAHRHCPYSKALTGAEVGVRVA
ncbi:Ohr family peroxiredoxin [Planobispora siamensis]|uniref:Peroxiredoxin, Ohr subfamily n=1 Tax=Planobispora siamensis TaxID=936338 RepID=A0A8J3SFL3_9ACTN|nr:Ohr family peroxiredoxin [Planobispora siamensis]GIH92175.1 hypothetical protein Psi01_28050 [Planobispora siamensis]